MKKLKTIIYISLACMSIGYVQAQYEMTKHTINNGGATMSGDGYELESSIGQVDAHASQSNGQYALKGGFWQGNNDLIFKNNIE